MSDPTGVPPSTEEPAPEAVPEQPAEASPDVPPAVQNRLRLIQGTPLRRKSAVAIIGFTEHRLQAPLGDPEVECWGLNELYRYMPVEKFDRWFELHDRADFVPRPNYPGDPEHIKSLTQFKIPVYTNAPWPEGGPLVPLPKVQIEQCCGTYMTSSIAWMIGLALLEGFERIGIFGVDMAQDTEYQEQRPCCEYLMGLALGRGVSVYVPPTSDLMKAVGQYGFGSVGSQFALKLQERRAWLQREHDGFESRLTGLEKEYQQKLGELNEQYHRTKNNFVTNLHQIEGALDNCRYFQRSWGIHAASLPGTPPNPLERPGMPKLAAFQSEPQKPDSGAPVMVSP